jgi:hypothetical protein
VRLEGLGQLKYPITSLRNKPVTLRLVSLLIIIIIIIIKIIYLLRCAVVIIITETFIKPGKTVKNRINNQFWKLGTQRQISNCRIVLSALAEPG